jgi:hypothetical protein
VGMNMSMRKLLARVKCHDGKSGSPPDKLPRYLIQE